ncbi:Bor/Iss family lipoprotein [Candidatus Palauibacter sp.]|uniref:Bor/Iss family lipoprotein n=1 Tax=Candidatus Palauibacter sp. TaxID=3101350 RepID=UPI003B525E2A
MIRIVTTIAAVSLFTGCASHHAVVMTGIDPGPRKVEDKWADSYLDGVVPPGRVDAGTGCGEDGVAIVETRISFMNQLVSALTLGIYSPMEIVVTCGSAEETDEDETESEQDEAPGSPSPAPDGPKKRSNGPGGG